MLTVWDRIKDGMWALSYETSSACPCNITISVS